MQIIQANQVHPLKWVPYLTFFPSPQDLLHLICMSTILHFSHLQVYAPFVILSLLFSQQNYSPHYPCFLLIDIWIVGNLFYCLLSKVKESESVHIYTSLLCLIFLHSVCCKHRHSLTIAGLNSSFQSLLF